MHRVQHFWVAAIELAGSVDFSLIEAELGPPSEAGWPRDALRRFLRPSQLSRLFATGPALESPDPVVHMGQPKYPAALRRTKNPPPVLFYRGDLGLLDGHCVAVVGSRSATGGGRTLSGRIAGTLRDAGVCVVSGLARGIDSAAHEACPSMTAAVLGQGLSTTIPGARGALARRIVESGGVLVSEFAPSQTAAKWTFPRRNRIIAGLSTAVVVVEASRRSGALITAQWALEYGREVFAVPGSPLYEGAGGCVQLLSDGARLVTDGSEVVSALGLEPEPEQQRFVEPILELLGTHGADLETLASRLQMSQDSLLIRLEALELTGRVCRLPGDYFIARVPSCAG